MYLISRLSHPSPDHSRLVMWGGMGRCALAPGSIKRQMLLPRDSGYKYLGLTGRRGAGEIGEPGRHLGLGGSGP